MKLKMLHTNTFANKDIYIDNRYKHCILRWQLPSDTDPREGFYIGNEDDHVYDYLNSPLKKIL